MIVETIHPWVTEKKQILSHHDLLLLKYKFNGECYSNQAKRPRQANKGRQGCLQAPVPGSAFSDSSGDGNFITGDLTQLHRALSPGCKAVPVPLLPARCLYCSKLKLTPCFDHEARKKERILPVPGNRNAEV